MNKHHAQVLIERTKAQQFWWGQWWIARTVFSKRFWNEPFEDYPQTWYYMPHWKPIRLFVQWICGMTTGHEKSKTEWGFAGGEYVDVNCRWCDKVIQVSITEARFVHPTFDEMRPDKFSCFADSDTGQQPSKRNEPQ